MHLTLRQAIDADWPSIWPFWHAIVAAGRTYSIPVDTDEATARELWMLRPPGETWVAVDADGRVVGSATLDPNRPGPGSHVAHASFMVDPAMAGRGVGRLLAEGMLDRARALGYEAMQFNAVVADNPAVRLWQSVGFGVVGRVPDAFRRPDGSTVDLLVMWRRL